ncbi:hypothetical protein BSM4216_2677 [Bacillus smithii]|nr:hypothetical protein BSM4216_2677 [Bacillus smithii]
MVYNILDPSLFYTHLKLFLKEMALSINLGNSLICSYNLDSLVYVAL